MYTWDAILLEAGRNKPYAGDREVNSAPGLKRKAERE
jgi:hypothetical protein